MKPISVLTAEGGPKVRPVLAVVSIACAAFVLLLFGLGSVAFAQECSVTDLTCVTDTVGGPANDVGPTTDDIKGTVQDTVSQAADDVQGVLDGLIGPGELRAGVAAGGRAGATTTGRAADEATGTGTRVGGPPAAVCEPPRSAVRASLPARVAASCWGRPPTGRVPPTHPLRRRARRRDSGKRQPASPFPC